MPVDVGQSAFEAVVIVSQALVVQAEEVEDGRMEIIYGGDILFRLPAKGISGTIRMAPLNTGAGGNPCQCSTRSQRSSKSRSAFSSDSLCYVGLQSVQPQEPGGSSK